jgi:hypothetical protein
MPAFAEGSVATKASPVAKHRAFLPRRGRESLDGPVARLARHLARIAPLTSEQSASIFL